MRAQPSHRILRFSDYLKATVRLIRGAADILKVVILENNHHFIKP